MWMLADFGLTFTMQSMKTEEMMKTGQYHSRNPAEAMGSCDLLEDFEKIVFHLLQKLLNEDMLCMVQELGHVTDLRPGPIATSEASRHSVTGRRENGYPAIRVQFYIHENASSNSLEAEQSITANPDSEKEISTRSFYTHGCLNYK